MLIKLWNKIKGAPLAIILLLTGALMSISSLAFKAIYSDDFGAEVITQGMVGELGWAFLGAGSFVAMFWAFAKWGGIDWPAWREKILESSVACAIYRVGAMFSIAYLITGLFGK